MSRTTSSVRGERGGDRCWWTPFTSVPGGSTSHTRTRGPGSGGEPGPRKKILLAGARVVVSAFLVPGLSTVPEQGVNNVVDNR
ncbi:hypothetical protein B005_4984 [Nocardiopsis alba ATCC BAA-2165]|uniref:Uncharacterized protein n=1 Tax=Nocardiopsis alba (strain ATCC BAA-2165 / BE74) TaxID=1205910 RepID=J7L9G7_NOCAA|nr:hypothetical protein B005_4984 [Nocardiopsis alba ATCC BAA-2165]